VDASNGKLTGDVEGFVGKDGKVLIIRRIVVTYRLEAEESKRELIERVHEMHAHFCPVARSLEGSIEIETRLEIV
jgi:uncharacterized OsmC-like protein